VWAFLIALSIPILWVILGFILNFSSTWQLLIDTVTGIISFLMVFLIQNSQNRQSSATQLKLNELILSVEGASDRLIFIEGANEDDLERLKHVFRYRATKVSDVLPDDHSDTITQNTVELTG